MSKPSKNSTPKRLAALHVTIMPVLEGGYVLQMQAARVVLASMVDGSGDICEQCVQLPPEPLGNAFHSDANTLTDAVRDALIREVVGVATA